MEPPASTATFPATLRGLSHDPLRVRVTRLLRQAILDGVLQPHEALVEQAIAAELGVSRAPVREAIHALAQEGLVEHVPYKGSRVRSPTPREISEIHSLRAVLERFALDRTVETGQLGADPVLADACRRMEQHAADGDFAALTDEDLRFHRRLIELAEHSLLLDAWDGLEIRIRLVMRIKNTGFHDPLLVARNHRAILHALQSGDSERAATLIVHHVLYDTPPAATVGGGDPRIGTKRLEAEAPEGGNVS